MQEAAGGVLWSVYGKSVKSVDCHNRRFTVTLNRVKVFESAITTALQQSDHAVLSRQDHNDDDDPNDDQMSSSGHVAVMLNCPLLADDKLMNRHVNMTMTQLRQLFVSQHIQALLCDNRSLSLSFARHLCLGPFSLPLCRRVLRPPENCLRWMEGERSDNRIRKCQATLFSFSA